VQTIKGVPKRLVPRVIQPARPEYNVLIGRFLRPLEHVLYRAIGRVFGADVVMKGKNAFQTGALFSQAWSGYEDPVAVDLDASRFDQHQKTGLLSWTHVIYHIFCHLTNEELMWLGWRLHVRGFVRAADGSIVYEVDGCKCSGHIDTATGNVLVMCGAIYALLHSLGLARPGRCQVSVFDNGDDCTLVGERSTIAAIIPAIAPFFQKLGLVMKVGRVVDVLEEVTFCQTQPVFDGASWRMVRNPHVSMSKDVTILGTHFTGDRLAAQMFAISQCGMALTYGLPVLQAHYQAMGRGQEKGRSCDVRLLDTGFFRLAHGLKPGVVTTVTTAARVSFWRAFGIVPDTQVALEVQLDSRPPIKDGRIGHHALERLVLA